MCVIYISYLASSHLTLPYLTSCDLTLSLPQDQLSNQEEKTDTYIEKLRAAETALISSQAAATQEIDGLKRLLELYKGNFEDASSKVDELEGALQRSRETHNSVLEKLKEKVATQFDQLKAEFQAEKVALESGKHALEKQVQELLEAQKQWQHPFGRGAAGSGGAAAIVPDSSNSTAAAAAAAGESSGAGSGAVNSVLAIQNFDGISVTDLYDRLVHLEKELFSERDRRQEVELYMQQILRDVETKAPLIAAQRRDYHRVVESHTQLTRRLDGFAVENLELKEMLRQAQGRLQQAEEEAQVVSEHNADLSRQVQHLLRRSLNMQYGIGSSSSALDERQQQLPVPIPMIEDGDDDGASPDGVVSSYLVTFDDVMELQRRNADLLRVVRTLSKPQSQHQRQLEMQQQQQENGDGDGSEQQGGVLLLTNTPAGNSSTAKASTTPTPTPGSGGGSGSGSGGGGGLSAALRAAMEELGHMREARQRMEDMVKVLTQQRDMYKGMVEGGGSDALLPAGLHARASLSPTKTPISSNSSEGKSSGVKSTAGGFPAGMTSPSAVEQQVQHSQQQKLSQQLSQAQEDVRRLQERLGRYEESEAALNQALDKARQEATSARMEGAQSSSEARFQRERVERLEAMNTSLQQESASSLQRRLEMERTLLDLHKEVRTKDDQISELSDELRRAHDAQHKAETEAEIAKNAQERAVQQAADAREEVKRHVDLVQQLHRIESGLQSRAETERENLIREKESIAQAYETLRKQLDDRSLIEEQRSKVSEEELRTLRARLEQRTAELATLREQLVREQATVTASQERSALLERQLSIANERNAATQGSQILDVATSGDLASRDLALDRAQAEISSLRQQLAAVETHAEQFRKISASNESALKALRHEVAQQQAAEQQELDKLRHELEAAHSDVAQQRKAAQEMLGEAEEARAALRAGQAEASDKIRSLEEQVALAQQEAAQVRTQSASALEDVARYQEQAQSNYATYERELQLHAAAETKVRELRAQQEETSKKLRLEQQHAAELSTACIRAEKLLADERDRAKLEVQQLSEQLSGLQRTNDLLHAQVQSYGQHIERLQENRMQAMGSVGGSAAAASSASSSSSSSAGAGAGAGEAAASQDSAMAVDGGSATGGVAEIQAKPLSEAVIAAATTTTTTITTPATATITAATGGDEGAADEFDELSELRKASSELREVLRFMKRERDMLQARLTMAEGETSRLNTELQGLHRALDECRAELKRELDSRHGSAAASGSGSGGASGGSSSSGSGGVRSPEEFNRLMIEVNQVSASDLIYFHNCFILIISDFLQHILRIYNAITFLILILTAKHRSREQPTSAR